MNALFIATGNSHKTQEIAGMLGADFVVSDLSSRPELPEVEETGTTFSENARLKAVEISKQIQGFILSDDSGLEVDALGGEPGVYSARYAGQGKGTAENNAKLMREMKGKENRSARFQCVMVLAEAGEVLAEYAGCVEGSIISEQRGSEGFGYDPLFIPDGYDLTFAELGDDVKNQLSHRARALAPMISFLREKLS